MMDSYFNTSTAVWVICSLGTHVISCVTQGQWKLLFAGLVIPVGGMVNGTLVWIEMLA